MAIVVHSTASNLTASTTSGTAMLLGLKIRDVDERYLVVSVGYKANTVASSSVVWRPLTSGASDQSMTLLHTTTDATGNVRVELWGLLNPTASEDTASAVRITPNGTGAATTYGATCFQGVDQTLPFVGYVDSTSVPTNRNAQNGTSAATGTVGLTNDMTLTTTSGDLVVDAICWDINATSNNFWALGRATYFQRANATTAGTRSGLASALATSGTTSVTWRTFAGAVGGYNSGQSGRGYAHVGFPLRPSTSVVPYWVRPPHAPSAISATSGGIAGTRFNNLDVAGGVWPTAGGHDRYSLGTVATGPSETLSGTNSVLTYTSRSAVIITGLPASGAFPLNELVQFASQTGHAATNTVTLRIPALCAVGDIMIVALYTEPNTATFTPPADFTEIANVSVASGTTHKLAAYWARLDAGDITTGSYTFTSSSSAWIAGAATFYRGVLASGDPLGATTAAPTTNSGAAGATITATGLTTTQNDMLAIMVASDSSGTNKVWTPPVSTGGIAQRETFHELFIGEHPQVTAGAIANQTVGAGAGSWGAILFTLLPATTVTVHTKGASSMVAVATTRSVSRLMDNYNRAVATMSAVATTRAAARRMLPYKRAVASMSAVATTRSVANVLRYGRTVTVMSGVATTRSVSRRATYKRSVTRSGGVLCTVAALYINTGTLFTRSVASFSVAFEPRARITVRKATYTRAITAMSAVTTTRAVTKRMNPYKRSTAAMSAVATTRTVSRKMAPYKRSVTAMSGLARVVTVSYTQPAGVVGWTDYEPTLGNPWLARINDIPGTYPGCTFLFEAQLRSLVVGQKVYAKLVTHPGNADVVNSQIETASPYQDWQIVRSTADMGLSSGVYYKARIGKVSPHQGQIAFADIIVRDVA